MSDLDFSGAREALEQVARYSEAMEREPKNDDYLRQCRDGWAQRLSRCLVLNGVPYVGSGEPSLPVRGLAVTQFSEDSKPK